MPPEVLIRAGTCLIICGTIAHASNHITGLPRVFGALAQETLLIYFVHLCIVYGSIWNPGLFQLYGATLSPLQVLTVVLVLISAMTALAWQWNWLKHTSSRTAQWVAVTVGSLMVLSLVCSSMMVKDGSDWAGDRKALGRMGRWAGGVGCARLVSCPAPSPILSSFLSLPFS